MRGDILGAERRRFWHDEDKLEIVTSVGIGRATVAQRHEIRRQQIYAWRHDLKKKGLWSPDGGALFYPMDITVTAGVPMAQLPVPELPPPTAVKLRLRCGRCLHFDSTMDPVLLTALIRSVEVADRAWDDCSGVSGLHAKGNRGAGGPLPKTCCVKNPPVGRCLRSGGDVVTG
jgi:transposase